MRGQSRIRGTTLWLAQRAAPLLKVSDSSEQYDQCKEATAGRAENGYSYNSQVIQPRPSSLNNGAVMGQTSHDVGNADIISAFCRYESGAISE